MHITLQITISREADGVWLSLHHSVSAPERARPCLGRKDGLGPTSFIRTVPLNGTLGESIEVWINALKYYVRSTELILCW